MENLSSRVSAADTIAKESSIIQWLLSRIQKPETTVSQNKQYAAEIFAILLQSSAASRSQLIQQDGIDALLQLLSPYRKRDPLKGTEEEEFVENLFDCVTCCVDERQGKERFLEAEGTELCLIMLKEGKMSRPRSLRLLDHALGGPSGGPCCERMVEAAGLKPAFSLLMKKVFRYFLTSHRKAVAETLQHDNQATEHILGILASMLRSLPADSAPRIRLLAKFVEKNYEKIERIVQIRREYASKVSVVEHDITRERAELSSTDHEDRESEWLSRRLDAGLFSLQARPFLWNAFRLSG